MRAKVEIAIISVLLAWILVGLIVCIAEEPVGNAQSTVIATIVVTVQHTPVNPPYHTPTPYNYPPPPATPTPPAYPPKQLPACNSYGVFLPDVAK